MDNHTGWTNPGQFAFLTPVGTDDLDFVYTCPAARSGLQNGPKRYSPTHHIAKRQLPPCLNCRSSKRRCLITGYQIPASPVPNISFDPTFTTASIYAVELPVLDSPWMGDSSDHGSIATLSDHVIVGTGLHSLQRSSVLDSSWIGNGSDHGSIGNSSCLVVPGTTTLADTYYMEGFGVLDSPGMGDGSDYGPILTPSDHVIVGTMNITELCSLQRPPVLDSPWMSNGLDYGYIGKMAPDPSLQPANRSVSNPGSSNQDLNRLSYNWEPTNSRDIGKHVGPNNLTWVLHTFSDWWRWNFETRSSEAVCKWWSGTSCLVYGRTGRERFSWLSDWFLTSSNLDERKVVVECTPESRSKPLLTSGGWGVHQKSYMYVVLEITV